MSNIDQTIHDLQKNGKKFIYQFRCNIYRYHMVMSISYRKDPSVQGTAKGDYIRTPAIYQVSDNLSPIGDITGYATF